MSRLSAAQLPTDAIGTILSFLSPPDILQLTRVCKAWLKASNELSWMSLYRHLFRQYHHADHRAANSEWKRLTLERYAYQQSSSAARDAEVIRQKVLFATQTALKSQELIEKLKKSIRAMEGHLHAVETLTDFIVGKTSISDHLPPEKNPDWLMNVVITERLANQNALRHYFANSCYFSRITWEDHTYHEKIESSLITEFVVYFPSNPAPYYFRFTRHQSGWVHEDMQLLVSPYSFNLEEEVEFRSCALKYAALFPQPEQMKQAYIRLCEGGDCTVEEEIYSLYAANEYQFNEIYPGSTTATKPNVLQPNIRQPNALQAQKRIYDRILQMVPTIARARFILFLLRVAYCPTKYVRDVPSKVQTQIAVKAGLIQSQLPKSAVGKPENRQAQQKRQKKTIPLANEPSLLFPKGVDIRVSSLLTYIFSEAMMERIVSDMGYNTERIPLRLLPKDQLNEARDVLYDLWIRKVQPELTYGGEDSEDKYLDIIPHRPQLSKEALSRELVLCREAELLAALDSVPNAISIIEQVEDGIGDYYSHLFRSILVVERKSTEFATIESFVERNSHTGLKQKLTELYRLARATETERFEEALSNRKLLWYYGSTKLTNVGAILAFGPPPQPFKALPFLAPLGRGYHFTDALAHAAPLSRVSEEDSSSFLVLCDVALGNMFVAEKHGATAEAHEYDAENSPRAPDGYDSIFQVGRFKPSPQGDMIVDSELVLSAGAIVAATESCKALSDYNMYAVYRLTQHRMRYLVKIEWN